jgi:hypothetical protein
LTLAESLVHLDICYYHQANDLVGALMVAVVFHFGLQRLHLNMAAGDPANDLVEDLMAAVVFHFGLQRLHLNIGYCH